MDEAFSFDEAQGTDLLGAMLPAMQTHKDRQLVLVSTKGHSGSTFLNGFLEKGKLSLEDPETDIFFAEWSLAEDKSAYDAANWKTFHPALGHLITEKDITAASKVLSRGEFTRAYANQYTKNAESIFNMETWDAQLHSLSRPVRSKVGIGFEIMGDRSRSAIVAAYYDHDGKICLKVLNNRTGSDWLSEFLPLYADSRPLAIGGDKHPQNNVVVDQLRMDYPSIEIQQLTSMDFMTASASFRSLLEEKKLRHDGNVALRDAIQTAQIRPHGDSGFSFSHMSLPELNASVAAIRMIQQQPVKEKPFIYMGND